MVTVERRGYALGAEIRGVDGTRPLDAQAVRTIRQAILDHVVVYLHAQELEPAQLRDFAAHFGELDREHSNAVHILPEVIERANRPLDPNAPMGPSNVPADIWHADFSYTRNPAAMIFLLGKNMPDLGGETMFANTSLAYDALSDGMKRLLDSLECVHVHEKAEKYRPVVHPAVPVHPETGRKHLFITDRVKHFVGMTGEESRPLLDFVKSHATRYEFTYRHRWHPSDFVIWDNRGSIHFAVQDYDQRQVRRIWRATVVGPASGRFYDDEAAGTVEKLATSPAAAG